MLISISLDIKGKIDEWLSQLNAKVWLHVVFHLWIIKSFPNVRMRYNVNYKEILAFWFLCMIGVV